MTVVDFPCSTWTAKTALVDINSASEKELKELPGIGDRDERERDAHGQRDVRERGEHVRDAQQLSEREDAVSGHASGISTA